jgi:DNA repair protein RecO (recombination protein O)
LRFSYEDEGANPSIFRLLVQTLERLEKEDDAWLPLRYYEIRLSTPLGFALNSLNVQIVVVRFCPEDQFFSFLAGGVICPRCGEGLPNLAGYRWKL